MGFLAYCGSILFLIIVSSGAWFAMREHQQHLLDKERHTYLLGFPRGLDETSVISYLGRLSGTLRQSQDLVGQLLGIAPATVYEVIADNKVVYNRVRLPKTHEDLILTLLRSRGIRYEPEEEYERPRWRKIVEFKTQQVIASA
jgi:hypothetical protein